MPHPDAETEGRLLALRKAVAQLMALFAPDGGAEVLSADAYAAFEEAAARNGTSTVNTETGRRYREAVLEAGGSRPAIESFKAFRGREPQLDALLRHQGMAQAS